MTFRAQLLDKKGFTLIEVLVASLLIMLGVTGYVRLQSEYVFADVKLNLRTHALRLAQHKIADLSYFQGLADYNNISTNLGGGLAAGEVDVPLSSKLNLHRYTLQWQVEDLYLVDSNFDDIADRWVKTGEPFYPRVLPQYPHLKSIKVSVSWLDDSAESKQVDMYCTLAPLAKSQSFHTRYRKSSVFAKP